MKGSAILCLVSFLFVIFLVSCSGGGGNIVTPDPGSSAAPIDEASGQVLTPPPDVSGATTCFGLWQFVADKATGKADLVQLRTADKILNVLGFMEPPPLSLMDLDWPNLNIDFPNGTVDVGVKFTHPINDGIFTGFDVRGVVFGPEVTNADGLTIIPSPEFFKGVPFGYQDGLLGAPDSHADYEGLAGYKYFCDDLGPDDDLTEFFSDPANLIYRGSFSPNKKIQRNYHLDWNNVEHNFLVFNYAIYANYDWPVGEAPWFVDDWEMSTANSAEAFCCNVTELANDLYFADGSGGGDISLQVEVWDWQDDIADVTIKSLEPGVIAETSYDVGLGNMGTDYSYGFEFNYVPGTPTTTGDLDILITATDSKTFGECWFLDMLPASNSMYDELIYNCFVHTASVAANQPPVVDGVYLDGPSGCCCQFHADATDAEDPTADLVFWWSVEETGEPPVYDDNSGVTSGDTNTIVIIIPVPGDYTIDVMVEDTDGGQGFAPDPYDGSYGSGLRLVEAPLVDGQNPIDIGVDPVDEGNVFVLGDVPGDSQGLSSVTVWNTDMEHQITFNNIGSGITSGPSPSCPPSALDVAQNNYFTICWPEEDPGCSNGAPHDWSFNKATGASTGNGRWFVSYLYPYDCFNNNTATSGKCGNTGAFCDYQWYTDEALYYHCDNPFNSWLGAGWRTSDVYGVSGPGGVMFPPNVPYPRVDFCTSANNHAYIIEGSPENSIEAWATWDSPDLHYNVSHMLFRATFTNEPIDVSVDSNNRVIVLTDTSELFFFDGNLSPETPPSLDLSGCVDDPIAVDVDLTNDEIYVLSENGVTIVISQ